MIFNILIRSENIYRRDVVLEKVVDPKKEVPEC